MQREVCEHEVFSVSLLPQTSLLTHSSNQEGPLLKPEEQQHPHGSIAKPSTLLGHSVLPYESLQGSYRCSPSLQDTSSSDGNACWLDQPLAGELPMGRHSRQLMRGLGAGMLLPASLWATQPTSEPDCLPPETAPGHSAWHPSSFSPSCIDIAINCKRSTVLRLLAVIFFPLD